MIVAIGLDGRERDVPAIAERPLMDVLRQAGLVEAVCGGMCSCGTCLVFVEDERASTLSKPGEDEASMLEALAPGVANARLSCQVDFAEGLAGLRLRVASPS